MATLASKQVVHNVRASYELVSMLGEGGMGKVFLAIQVGDAEHPENIGRKVAIKFLELDLALSRVAPDKRDDRHNELMARFISEGRIGFELSHPHIIPTYDYGEDEERRPFLVSKFIEGVRPLSALRDAARYDFEKRYGKTAKIQHSLVPWSMLVRIGAQVADALAYMHDKQIAHRDIKPENILFTGEGNEVQIYIVDLGIAKNLDETSPDHKLTRDGSIVGTLTNMAPEQIFAKVDHEGKKWDKGTFNDVYAFGTVMYELLTGKFYVPMVETETEYAFLTRVVNDAPLSLSTWIEHPNQDLDLLIMQCLLKEPWLRPSMAEVRSRLQELCQQPSTYPEAVIKVGRGTISRSVHPDAPTVESVPPPAIPKAAKLPSRVEPPQEADERNRVTITSPEIDAKSSRHRMVAAGVGLLLALGVGGAWWYQDQSPRPTIGLVMAPASASTQPPLVTIASAPSAQVEAVKSARSEPVASHAVSAHSVNLVSAKPPISGEAAKIYQNGLSAYASNDWRRAEIGMRLTLEREGYEDLAKAQLIRAECLIHLGRKPEAKTLLLKYLQYRGTSKQDLSQAAQNLVSP